MEAQALLTAPDAVPAAPPPLTADTPDAALDAALRRDGRILGVLESRVGAAYLASRSIKWAPASALEQRWRTYSMALRQLRREQAVLLPNSAADWQARVTALRLALNAIADFNASAALTGEARTQAYLRDKADASAAVLAGQMGHQLSIAQAAPPPRFQPREYLQSLIRRGVALSVDIDGNLVATPAGVLTPADKWVIADLRPDLVLLLTAPERL